MVSVLFVCMGNICRSPMAEGVFTTHVRAAGLEDSITIDSAGTIGYHAGNPPDRRAVTLMKTLGQDISNQRSRKVTARDFTSFDYIIAMDHDNYQDLTSRAPADATAKIELFLTYGDNMQYDEVPDPYYGGDEGFELVYQLIDNAAANFLAELRAKHLS